MATSLRLFIARFRNDGPKICGKYVVLQRCIWELSILDDKAQATMVLSPQES